MAEVLAIFTLLTRQTSSLSLIRSAALTSRAWENRSTTLRPIRRGFRGDFRSLADAQIQLAHRIPEVAVNQKARICGSCDEEAPEPKPTRPAVRSTPLSLQDLHPDRVLRRHSTTSRTRRWAFMMRISGTFSTAVNGNRRRMVLAKELIRRNRRFLIKTISQWTGARRWLRPSSEVLPALPRSDLYMPPDQEISSMASLAALGTTVVMNYLHTGRYID